MKIISNTAIALTCVILLLFGNGGLALEHCSCSDTTRLLLPFDDGCCGKDSDCMTVTVYHLCDSGLGHVEDLVVTPQLETPSPMLICTGWNTLSFNDMVAYTINPCFSPPPGINKPNIIMRV